MAKYRILKLSSTHQKLFFTFHCLAKLITCRRWRISNFRVKRISSVHRLYKIKVVSASSRLEIFLVPDVPLGESKIFSMRINRSISPPTNSILSMLTSKELFPFQFLNSRISLRRGTNLQVLFPRKFPNVFALLSPYEHKENFKTFGVSFVLQESIQ